MDLESAEVRIEPATAGDVEWSAQIMASSEPWVTLRQTRQKIETGLRRAGIELWLAHRGPQRAGLIVLDRYGFAGSPYIKSVAVAPNERGRGIGTRMLNFAEEHFAGERFLFLLVSSFNAAAQRLYFRHGYEKRGELPNYIVEGYAEWILSKRLPPRN